MNLQYLQGTYMDEIMYEDKPVLFSLEGLPSGQEEEASRYGNEIWQWILEHRERLMAHAPLIANFKNKKWRGIDEPEVTADDILQYLKRINSVYVQYKGDFDVFFNAPELFQERSIVVRIGKNYLFEGLRIL